MSQLPHLKVTRKQLVAAGVVGAGVLALALGKKYFNGPMCKIHKDLTDKVIVITGGNTGIGKVTALELAKMNATVILACRDPKRTLPVVEELQSATKNSNIEFIQLDLADLQSIRTFVREFKSKYDRLDILINNAAVAALPKRTLTKDGFEAQFGTNHLGHFYLTTLLLDVIKASAPSRIVNVSAKAHLTKLNWDDLMLSENYEPIPAYMHSKLANIIFTRELQRRLDLENADVKVVSLHPGVIKTELSRYFADSFLKRAFLLTISPFFHYLSKDALHGVQTTLYCALEDQKALEGGAYYSDCKVKKLRPEILNEENGPRLWKVSEELISEKL